MELTGKAKQVFEDWYYSKYPSTDWRFIPYIMEYAAIIEWLDSVGLYIDRDTMERSIKIWDYISEEPSEPLIIDCQY